MCRPQAAAIGWTSMFSANIAYSCRPSTFFRIPVAHTFCNGLIKGFWRLVAREKTVVLAHGNDLILSQENRATIRRRAREMRATSAFTGPLPDIIQCAPDCTTHLCRAWMRSWVRLRVQVLLLMITSVLQHTA
jgi:hypothetical protein